MLSVCACVLSAMTLYTYSTRMSPENTHKLMGFYMEVENRRYTSVHGFCFFNPFASEKFETDLRIREIQALMPFN